MAVGDALVRRTHLSRARVHLGPAERKCKVKVRVQGEFAYVVERELVIGSCDVRLNSLTHFLCLWQWQQSFLVGCSSVSFCARRRVSFIRTRRSGKRGARGGRAE